MEDTFYIDMPVELELVKSQTTGDISRRCVKGFASTEALDQSGESVLQKGLDWAPLKATGFINYDHQKREIAGAQVPIIIGYPTDVIMKSHGLWVEGELLNPGTTSCPELQLADYMWQLGMQLQKSGSDRRLAYSVEGGILERRGNKVVRAIARHVALTHKPVNTDCSVEVLAKSFCCGKCSPDHPGYNPAHVCGNKHVEVESLPALEKAVDNAMSTDSAGALLKQNLDRGMTTVLYGDTPDDCYDASTGRFKDGLRGAHKHMTDHLGHGTNETTQFLRKLITGATKNADLAVLVKTAGITG